MHRACPYAAIFGAAIIGAAGCGGGGGGGGGQDVGVATNLWWDENWAQDGAAAPIEVLNGPLVAGQLVKVRVRFMSDGEASPTEIGLRVLRPPPADQPEALVEECSLGDFVLDPPAGAGENVYEIETVVPAIDTWGYQQCKLVAILDPRNKIAETVEIPEGEPTDASGRGDNSLAVDVEISTEVRLNIDIEDLKIDPDVLVFDAREIPAVAIGGDQRSATFFGEDLNGSPARVARMPRSGSARAAFLSALGDPRLEDFDTGFTGGQDIAASTSPVSFAPLGWGGGTAVSGTIEGSLRVTARKVAAPQTSGGSYPTSGEFFLEMSDADAGDSTTIRIDLPADKPQRALGFNVTGLGDVAGSTLSVGLGKRNQGGGFTGVGGGPIPLPPLGDAARRNGAVLFFGVALIDAASTSFDHIEITLRGGPDMDACGVDDIIIASDVRFDPSSVCSLDTGTMIAANFGVSLTSIFAVGSLPLEVDFRIRDHGDLTDALRSAGKLPIRVSADASSAAGAIEIPVEGGESQKVHEPMKRIDYHLQVCPPAALTQAAAGLIDPDAEPGTTVDLTVDVTFRVPTDARHGVYGSEKTSAVTVRFVTPTPPKGIEWNYFKYFGNDTIGGQVDFRSGIFADGKGATGCAAGEFDLTLFGQRIESIVDACARASCEVSAVPSTAGLALQFRTLSLGFEDGKVVTRHQVIYEKRGEVEFQDESTPPKVKLDLQPYGTDPSLFDLQAGKFGLDLADAGNEDDGIVLGKKSWSKCKTWVVYCIPMWAEVEIGGKVGLRTHFQAIRGPERIHQLSLLAGPSIRFYGGASVFLGACADELVDDLDKAPEEVVQAVDEAVACGKVAGASIDLTFLDFLVGPKGTAVLTPMTRDGVDGVDVKVGISVGAELTVLKGSLSLWVHYMEPHLCWTSILGVRTPYVCNPWVDCKTAGITIASFPGFTFESSARDLAGAEFFVPFGVGSVCETCPRQ